MEAGAEPDAAQSSSSPVASGSRSSIPVDSPESRNALNPASLPTDTQTTADAGASSVAADDIVPVGTVLVRSFVSAQVDALLILLSRQPPSASIPASALLPATDVEDA